METPETLAGTLRSVRKSKDWSQSDLAVESHVSLRTIVDVETGKQASPRVDVVIRLAHALGQDVDKWIKLVKYPHEVSKERIQRALERSTRQQLFKKLPGSDTVATVEDLKFLESLMAQTTNKPLTFFDIYELLCRFRIRN